MSAWHGILDMWRKASANVGLVHPISVYLFVFLDISNLHILISENDPHLEYL